MINFNALVQLQVGDRKFLNVVELFKLPKRGEMFNIFGYKFTVEESNDQLKAKAKENNASVGAVTGILRLDPNVLSKTAPIVINSLLLAGWKEKWK